MPRACASGCSARISCAAELRDPADDEDSANPKVRFPGLKEAERRVEYFYETRARLIAKFGGKPVGPSKQPDAIRSIRERFVAAMDDDLNTANALAAVADLFKRANELCDGGKQGIAEAQHVTDAITFITSVLGVAEGDPEAFFQRIRTRRVRARGIDPSEIDKLVDDRNAARKEKNFRVPTRSVTSCSSAVSKCATTPPAVRPGARPDRATHGRYFFRNRPMKLSCSFFFASPPAGSEPVIEGPLERDARMSASRTSRCASMFFGFAASAA